MSLQVFNCRECGKSCKSKEFHDYIECIRYRWLSNRVRRDGPEGNILELRAAESDLKALLACIDLYQPAPRSPASLQGAVTALNDAAVLRAAAWIVAEKWGQFDNTIEADQAMEILAERLEGGK